MSFQYTYDAKGKPIGVFVPISEWVELTTEIKRSQLLSKTKSATLKSILKGMQQVDEIEKGKIKSIPLKQLLDEL